MKIAERGLDPATLQELVDSVPALIHTARPDGYLDFFNRRWLDWVGLRLEDLEGWKWTAAIHPDDVDALVTKWRTCLESGEPFEFESRVRRADGRYRWMLHHKLPLRNAAGKIVKWCGSSVDIDDRKRAEFEVRKQETELRRSKAHLADAQRLSRTGSVGMEVSTQRIFWSDEAARIYGYPPGTEPTPELILQRSHPDDLELLTDVLRRAGQGGTDFDYEHRLLMPDGAIKHLHDLAHRVKDEAGNDEIIGAILDITERKLAEDAIGRSEAYLAEAQRLSHTGSFGWKPHSGEIVWSDETYRIFEYDRAQTPTLNMVLQRTHPLDRTRAQQVIEDVSRNGTDFEHEHRLLMPGGAIKHIHVRAHAVRDSSGHLEFIGAVIDITERRAGEQKLVEQEAEFRQMLDLSPQLAAIFGPARERLYVNRTALEYLGITYDEWQQNRPGFAIHPDDVEPLYAYADRAASTGSAYEVEIRIRKRDGTYRWFQVRFNPVRDDKGEIRRWYWACTDVDDRKRAQERLEQENVALREEIDKASMFEEIVGASPKLASVISRLSKVARSDSTVLITGETGTGKELVARAIHRRSSRSSRAFVSVNCAAIPRDLIASELFGHEKGAFTGAVQRRLGRFELGDGGTIFLDEVGELPMETQIALLRVVQEREFERVGGSAAIRIDVRVIAATNRDLETAIEAGTFRQDLFYRLNVFPIAVPPLRDRADDIPLLVEYFIDRYARKAGKKIRRVNKRTLDRLQEYRWPGNVRELQNVIERSVIVCDTDEFTVDESWLSAGPAAESRRALSSTLASQEKTIIEEALQASGGRVYGPSGAAARLGIARSTLESKIRALGVNKNRFRGRPAKS